jgi:hypothetical protein
MPFTNALVPALTKGHKADPVLHSVSKVSPFYIFYNSFYVQEAALCVREGIALKNCNL